MWTYQGEEACRWLASNQLIQPLGLLRGGVTVGNIVTDDFQLRENSELYTSDRAE